MTTKDLVPDLEVILAAKRRHLVERKSKTPIEAVRALASMQKRPQPVLSTVAHDTPVMIMGQIKHALPQSDDGSQTYDPVANALRYASVGVDAVALFTDATLYARGLDDLVLVSRAVNMPVISQDFILDEYQVVETRAAGASALVLYAAILEPVALRSLMSATHRNRMTAIIEVQTAEELEYALTLSPNVIGLNCRDAHTWRLNLDHAHHLRRLVPAHVRVMMNTGLATLDEVKAVLSVGVHALLVRDSILLDPDQTQALKALVRAGGALD